MTNFKRFGKDLIIYGLSSSMSKFVGVLLIPLYTHYFSAEEFGSFDLIATIVMIAAILGMIQMESGVSRYYYAKKEESKRRKMVSTAAWMILSCSILLLILFLFFSELISQWLFKDTQYAGVIFVAAMTIPLMNLNGLFTVLIRFQKQPVTYLIIQVTQSIVMVGVTVYLIAWVETGIAGIFWGQIAAYSVTAIVMVFLVKRNLAFVYSIKELKSLARYSLPLVPSAAGNWLNSYVNRFVMLGYLSVSDIGIFAVAIKVGTVFKLMGAAFKMAWGPFFWEMYENNENHRQLFADIQKMVMVSVTLIVILVTLFATEIIQILATEEYFYAAKMIGIISLALALSSIISQTVGLGPSIRNQTEYNTIIYFGSVGVNILSLFLLVPSIGLIGVPISLLLSSLALIGISWVNSEKLYPVGFNKMVTIACIAFSLIVIIIVYFVEITIYIKILLSMIFTLIFAGTIKKHSKTLFSA